jgi:oligosaccharide repeat unit polymerase
MEGLMGIARAFHVLMTPLACLLFATGLFYSDLNILFWGMVLLFVANIVYACADLGQRLLFLFFHGGLALFFISRPTIGVLYYHHPLSWFSLSFDGAVFSLSVLFLSMLCLRIGSSFIEWRRGPQIDNREALASGIRNNPHLPTLRIASGIVFFVGFAILLWMYVQRWQMMQGMDYEQYYLQNFSANTTLLERTLATMEPYALCAFLATLPTKRLSLIALSLHLLTTIPLLLIGTRGSFVLAVLFIVLYYILRERIDGKGTWIGRFEKTVAIIVIPLGILGLGMMNYIRANTQAYGLSIVDLLADALYKQGASYTVLSRAYQVHGQIEMLGFKGYSFGSLTDYILYGPFGTILLGTTDLYTGNNIHLAVQGHSFAHANAYYAHWNYLGGEGFGSSYLLELYQDFGYLGIAVFSLFFGALLNAMQWLFAKGWFWGTLVLTSAAVLFHVPRGATAEWIEYIWTPQFWFTIVLIILGASILRYKKFRGFIPSNPASAFQLAVHHFSSINSGPVKYAESLKAPDARLKQFAQLSQNRKATGSDHEDDNIIRSAWHNTTSSAAHPPHNNTLVWLGNSAGPVATGANPSPKVYC